MLLRNEILGLPNPTDILVLEDGLIYLDKKEQPIASFGWGTVNVRQHGEYYRSGDKIRTLPGEMIITVILKPFGAPVLPKRFNVLATANKGQQTVGLQGVLISEIDGAMTLEGEDYRISKCSTLTCYAERIIVKETGNEQN